MSFTQAIGVCFRKYATFSGRAGRREYWWFFLFYAIVNLVISFIPFVGFIVWLALLLPSLAVTARRLHDTDRSGWWALLPFGLGLAGLVIGSVLLVLSGESDTPGTSENTAAGIAGFLTIGGGVVGFIALLRFLVNAGDEGENRYGPPPGGPSAAPALGGAYPDYGGGGAAGQCPHCGAGVQPGAAFCTACGAVL